MAEMDDILMVDKLPYLDMRSFKMVVVKDHQEGVARLRGDVQLFFEWDRENELVCFRYSYNGHFRKHSVAVRKADTNLGVGEMYWFVCPITDRLCRKLYFVGGLMMSWFALKKGRYPSQYLTANEKVHYRDRKYEQVPVRKYGKPYYRGKLTPYGKRLIRYNERYEANGEIIDEMMMKVLYRHRH